jgi:HSP20 family protein
MYASLLNHPNSLFGQFERLRRELDDVFGAISFSGLPSSIRSVTPGTLPAVNVGRTPTSVEVYAFAPGLDAAKIEVTLDRGVLRISGDRVSGIPGNDPKLQVYTRERGAGRFTRAIALPDDIDPARVNASYRDGVLQVSIARRESAQPQRITVQ